MLRVLPPPHHVTHQLCEEIESNGVLTTCARVWNELTVFCQLADRVQKFRRLDVSKFGRGFSVRRPTLVRGVGGGVVGRRHASVEVVTFGVVFVGRDLVVPGIRDKSSLTQDVFFRM